VEVSIIYVCLCVGGMHSKDMKLIVTRNLNHTCKISGRLFGGARMPTKGGNEGGDGTHENQR